MVWVKLTCDLVLAIEGPFLYMRRRWPTQVQALRNVTLLVNRLIPLRNRRRVVLARGLKQLLLLL